jgi:uncharacterized protein (TIGR03435 family)
VNPWLLFAANHLWQSTVFAAAAGLMALALRRNAARMRHWVWTIASVKFLIPFWLFASIGSHLGWLKAPAAPAARLSVAVEYFSQPFLALPVRAAVPAPAAADALPYILLAVWFGGCIAVLFSWRRRWRMVAAAVRAASPLPVEMRGMGVRVMSSPALLEPGVFGILHPVLLLPKGIERRLTPEQLQAILAHELCHIRRRDNLAAAVQMAVEAVCWFHPLVWWMGSRLVEERERACDEEVLRAGNEPRTYAEGILLICKFYLELPVACASGVTGSDLKKRIAAIIAHRPIHRVDFGRKLLLAASGIAAVAGPVMIGLWNAPATLAQPLSGAMAPVGFEAASIKPSPDVDGGRSIHPSPGGGLIAGNATLKSLILLAYNIRDFQLAGGPGWLDSAGYDIVAKPSPGTRGDARVRLQSLLADRFKLKFHREMKELPVFALIVERNGLKLQEARREPKDGDGNFHAGRGRLTGQMVSMPDLAGMLSGYVGRTVQDRTGVKGLFDFKLDWTPDESQSTAPDGAGETPPDASGPSIFTALQERLGLKLEPSKGPVEIIVIDHAEKATEN